MSEPEHLATKEELLRLKVDIQKLKSELILWIIATNIGGGVVITAMIYLATQFAFIMQHWKP
jgi:hypothetical protein